MKVNIDLRKETDDMLKDYAIDILCQKSSKYFRCTCYKDIHKSPDPNCHECNGTGKMVGFQRHRAIVENFEAGNSKSAMRNTEIGQSYAPDVKFYVTHDNKFNVKDIIFTVGFRNNRVSTLHNAYEINYVEPVRGDSGRIELYAVYAKASPTYMNTARKIVQKFKSKDILQGKTYYV